MYQVQCDYYGYGYYSAYAGPLTYREAQEIAARLKSEGTRARVYLW